MPNTTLAVGLMVPGGQAWALWLGLIAGGATLALTALMLVFTGALYRHHERVAPVALHFTLANLFASVYVLGNLAVHLDRLIRLDSTVMTFYRLCLAAIVMVLASLMALEGAMGRRPAPARRLAIHYLAGLAISGLLWIRHPWLIIVDDQYTADAGGVFAHYGALAAPFFLACLGLFVLVVFRILRRARRSGGSLAWHLALFGFSVFSLAGLLDTLRELGVPLLPFSALIPGCVCFQIGAFAAMALHYSQTLRERVQHNDQLRRLRERAALDPLSGLFNRAHLERHLENAGPRAAGGLLFVDLDHFKAVNDRFGHDLGDRLIIAVADCLRATLREGDIASRWGGDEFVVYLANADAQAGPLIEGRLLRAFADVRLPAAPELVVSASMGFAQLSDGDWRRTLQRADQALYRSKAGGRRRLTVAP